jgi:hypothetical protein
MAEPPSSFREIEHTADLGVEVAAAPAAVCPNDQTLAIYFQKNRSFPDKNLPSIGSQLIE